MSSRLSILRSMVYVFYLIVFSSHFSNIRKKHYQNLKKILKFHNRETIEIKLNFFWNIQLLFLILKIVEHGTPHNMEQSHFIFELICLLLYFHFEWRCPKPSVPSSKIEKQHLEVHIYGLHVIFILDPFNFGQTFYVGGKLWTALPFNCVLFQTQLSFHSIYSVSFSFNYI